MRTGATAVVVVVTVLLLGAPGALLGDTILVDPSGGGYATIQEGLDAALDGDVIQVAPGTYSGPGNIALSFGSKNLVLEAEMGFPTVTIDCMGADRAVSFSGTAQDTSTAIRGFIIRNGYSGAYASGGAINAYGVSIVIEDCLFEDCSAYYNAGAVYIGYTGMGHGTKVRNCVFHRNSAPYRAGALMVDHGGANVWSCLFYDNSTTEGGEDFYGGGAIHLNWVDDSPNYRFDMVRCTIAGNSSGGNGSGIFAWNSNTWTFLSQSIVAFNEGPGLGVDSSPMIDGFTFSIVHGNEGGDTEPGYTTLIGDDPRFCHMSAGDYSLCDNSPALPAGNIYGMLMGYAPIGGCGECDSAVVRSSWGAIKALYRAKPQ
jgi:hypothetical protein